MLRLLFLLCAALFITLLLGGRDHGQLRPGLQVAEDSNPAPVLAPPPRAEPVAYIPDPAPASTLPIVLPLVSPTASAPTPAPVARPEAPSDIRYVTARVVNVRGGPSTGHPVIGSLTQGEAARIIHDPGNGWAHILIEGDGIDGYVSTRFLSPETP